MANAEEIKTPADRTKEMVDIKQFDYIGFSANAGKG
jgi:hypothetical protein